MGQLSGASSVPSLTVGGRVFTDLDNLIILAGGVGANARCTPRKMNATTGYQVPVGKTFYLQAIELIVVTASAATTLQLYYADTDLGQNSAAAFVNNVAIAGDSSAAQLLSCTVAGIFTRAVNFQVPAGKYLGVTGGGYQIQLYGYER